MAQTYKTNPAWRSRFASSAIGRYLKRRTNRLIRAVGRSHIRLFLATEEDDGVPTVAAVPMHWD